jgi:hypothetical protein
MFRSHAVAPAQFASPGRASCGNGVGIYAAVKPLSGPPAGSYDCCENICQALTILCYVQYDFPLYLLFYYQINQ